uniref:Tyrosine-protein kinase receptor n=2 Tax=Dendroctonus ponderosae TaxID=77166 RepID=A0AAR5PW78_DENPD
MCIPSFHHSIEPNDFLREIEPFRRSPAYQGVPLMAGKSSAMWLGILRPCAIILAFQFFLFLPLSFKVEAAELLYPVPEHGICKSLDIRNKIDSFKQLEGCQVIEGSLQILLFDNLNETEFSQISFPALREITGYFLLFRVNSLKTVGQLFPNLAVIRGQHLFPGGKSLVIFEMASLQEIGLHSLTHIMNGKVHIDRNPSLCFVHSIDWTKIISTEDPTFIKSLKPENECPVCPQAINGKACPRNERNKNNNNNKYLCWNRNHCQKICTGCGKRSCNDEGECCHPRCIGGCGADTTKCFACQEFVFSAGEDDSSKCVQMCPRNYLAYLERRCVTHSECVNMTRPIDFEDSDSETTDLIEHPYKIHDGSCVLHCPPNYSGNYTDHSCSKCNNTCRKECPGARIDSINLASQLRSCTHITGSVEIQIKGGNQVVKALQENLGMIEEIDDYLKVVRSFSLLNLNFFKSLRRIGGRNLESQRYSIIVLDNQNLQDLFDWSTHKDFKIDHGRLFFHFNPKLCLGKIEELRNKANLSASTEMEVAQNSNGDKAACMMSKLNVTIATVSSKSVTLKWFPLKIDDPRNLLRYSVHSIEAPTKTVNFFDGRDACGQDNWRVEDEANNLDQPVIKHTLNNLKPYTQYAFFVKTYTIATEKNGAQSDINYFRTKPSEPSAVEQVQIVQSSSSSLRVSWSPPHRPNGKISYFKIYGTKHKDISLPNRNYCTDTVIPDSTKSKPIVTPQRPPQVCNNTNDKIDTELTDEQEEVLRIEFENALHNKVYIKRPSRMRRDVDQMLDANSANSTEISTVDDPHDYMFFDNINSADKKMENSTEPATQFWKTFIYTVNASVLSLEVDNLRHFTEYDVTIYCCREKEEDDHEEPCGEPAYDTAQTLPKKGADNILNATIVNTTSNSVTVRWAQPSDPNRMIVAVTISYKREDTENSHPSKECISFRDFKNYSKNGLYLVHTIPNLLSGNHSLFLTASSLYGMGDPSPTLVFYVPESSPNTVLITSLVLLFIFMCIMGGAWIFYKKSVRDRERAILVPAVNPDYQPSVYTIDEWEVPRKNVEMLKELGQGSFGMVWEGIGRDFQNIKGSFRCAVKTVNEHATSRERIDFLNEASVMKAFNTTHVVKLLGVVSQGQPALVIMELMVNGDLKTYLRSHRPENDGNPPPSLKEILQMAIEIADGMAYLEGKKFVHRDLAARNCMVSENLTVKIGDFGMTRDIYETDYYRKGSRGLLPVRWMSPESLKDGVFSSSSDAWSYGVVLWEMATLASQPYQGLSNEQVLRYIMEGGIMERPENCPDKLYEIMRLCWDLKPGRRPTFMHLCEMLLPDSSGHFASVSFYHSAEGAETRAIRAAAAATAEIAIGDVGDGDDADASTPLNALPPDVHIAGAYAMSASERSDSIQSIHVDPNPKFYSISEDRTANGFAGGDRARNGKAQSHC